MNAQKIIGFVIILLRLTLFDRLSSMPDTDALADSLEKVHCSQEVSESEQRELDSENFNRLPETENTAEAQELCDQRNLEDSSVQQMHERLFKVAKLFFDKKYFYDCNFSEEERDEYLNVRVSAIVEKLQNYCGGEDGLPTISPVFNKQYRFLLKNGDDFVNLNCEASLKQFVLNVLDTTWFDLDIDAIQITYLFALLDKVIYSVDEYGIRHRRYKINPEQLPGLFLIGLMLSCKVNHDDTYNPNDWNEIGDGCYSNVELQTMELFVCDALNWNLLIKDEELFGFFDEFNSSIDLINRTSNELTQQCISFKRESYCSSDTYLVGEPTCSIKKWVCHLFSKPEFRSTEIKSKALVLFIKIALMHVSGSITVNNIYRLFFGSICLAYQEGHSDENADEMLTRFSEASKIVCDSSVRLYEFSYSREQIRSLMQKLSDLLNSDLSE
jgi:hypothetical protein